jgi:hypothetical protein
MMVNGEELAKNTNRAMNVVIVNGAPHVSRSLYLSEYNPKTVAAPDCWSNDGINPMQVLKTRNIRLVKDAHRTFKAQGKCVSRL